eukprot:GEMP01006067.1.p1 GENE.GEMP01006067.1~~GEMP01006067.1.p1  ORF type:complete len:1099 (+),score=270.69 GEMP01006067.1:108-3404(+)
MYPRYAGLQCPTVILVAWDELEVDGEKQPRGQPISGDLASEDFKPRCTLLSKLMNWDAPRFVDENVALDRYRATYRKEGFTSQPKPFAAEFSICPLCCAKEADVVSVCGHGACYDCWEKYLTENRFVENVTCWGCAHLIDSIARSYLAPKTWHVSLLKMARDALDSGVGACYRCGHGFLSTLPLVECERCNARNCAQCDDQCHWPLPCGDVADMVGYSNAVVECTNGYSAGKDQIVAVTRSCPHCKRAMEKNAGCNHITCKCGKYFKWNAQEQKVWRASDFHHFTGAQSAVAESQVKKVRRLRIQAKKEHMALVNANAIDCDLAKLLAELCVTLPMIACVFLPKAKPQQSPALKKYRAEINQLLFRLEGSLVHNPDREYAATVLHDTMAFLYSRITVKKFPPLVDIPRKGHLNYVDMIVTTAEPIATVSAMSSCRSSTSTSSCAKLEMSEWFDDNLVVLLDEGVDFNDAWNALQQCKGNISNARVFLNADTESRTALLLQWMDHTNERPDEGDAPVVLSERPQSPVYDLLNVPELSRIAEECEASEAEVFKCVDIDPEFLVALSHDLQREVFQEAIISVGGIKGLRKALHSMAVPTEIECTEIAFVGDAMDDLQERNVAVVKTPNSAREEKTPTVRRTADDLQGMNQIALEETPDSTREEKNPTAEKTADDLQGRKCIAVVKTPNSAEEETNLTAEQTADDLQGRKHIPVEETPNSAGEEKTPAVGRTADDGQGYKSSMVDEISGGAREDKKPTMKTMDDLQGVHNTPVETKSNGTGTEDKAFEEEASTEVHEVKIVTDQTHWKAEMDLGGNLQDKKSKNSDINRRNSNGETGHIDRRPLPVTAKGIVIPPFIEDLPKHASANSDNNFYIGTPRADGDDVAPTPTGNDALNAFYAGKMDESSPFTTAVKLAGNGTNSHQAHEMGSRRGTTSSYQRYTESTKATTASSKVGRRESWKALKQLPVVPVNRDSCSPPVPVSLYAVDYASTAPRRQRNKKYVQVDTRADRDPPSYPPPRSAKRGNKAKNSAGPPKGGNKVFQKQQQRNPQDASSITSGSMEPAPFSYKVSRSVTMDTNWTPQSSVNYWQQVAVQTRKEQQSV